MMPDPLDLLGDLPYWPGKTPPKNAGQPKKRTTEDLNGARGVTYKINGVQVELFTIGELSKAIGRKPVTIRMWESQGWIPKANYRTPTPQGEQIPGKATKGRRLYTRAQVVFLAEAVTMFNLDKKASPDWVRFRNHVKANWPT